MGREERVNVRLSADLAKRADRVATERGQTRAEYARSALARAVSADEGGAGRK